MRVVHVKILRRSMMGIILVVLLAVAFNYLQTWRSRAHAFKQVTEVLSTDMMRSADSIEYTTYENGKIRFKIHAERLLETREGKNLLQGVEASDRNPDGSVGNRIRSQRANYDADHKLVDFSGNVQLEIGAEVQIRTSLLHYDLNTNLGSTNERIRFASKEAQGEARGVLYNQARKTLDLKQDLDFTMTRATGKQDGSSQTEHIRATSNHGYYSRDERLLRFEGHAHLDSESASLSGNTIDARFSEDQKHLASLICDGDVTYQSKKAEEPLTLQGDRMAFDIDPSSGSLRGVDVGGHAGLTSKANTAEQELRGAGIRMEFDPASGLPKHIQSQGGVQLQMKHGEEETLVTGENLDTVFAAGTNLLQVIHVLGHARMLTRHAMDDGRDELSAQEIVLHFRESQGTSTLSELQADRAVQLSSTPPRGTNQGHGDVARSLSADSLNMTYSPSGDYFESGTAYGSVALSGIPLGENGHSEIRKLSADSVNFHFFAGGNRLRDFQGNGHVQIYYHKPADEASETPSQEFHTSSSHMTAAFKEDGTAQSITQWGNFQYQDAARTANSGRGDFDAQKETMLLRESPRIADAGGTTTGDTVEYDRSRRVLSVRGHVRSLLKNTDNGQASPFANSSSAASPSIITADDLQYWSDDAQGRYSGDVQLLSENGQLQAKILEVYKGGERVEAQGSVRHLLPRKEADDSTTPDRKTGADQKSGKNTHQAPISIASGQLAYLRIENTIHYLGGVELTSGDTDLTAERLDALLDKEGKQVERAEAKGRVVIHQGGRSVKGDTADYNLVGGKFVVQGIPAEIWDPARGKSAAQRLTFFTSNVRILLDNH